MYTKQQASRLRQEFWTAFGRYMQPVRSSEGEPANWINYKTGARHIYFRMRAGNGASIAIELTDPHTEPRLSQFQKLLELRHLLHDISNEQWKWEQSSTDEHGKEISRISLSIENVQLFNKADWPALNSFFKPRIIALDAFWSQVKYEFDAW